MIKLIEELSMNAFPALYTNLLNGWIIRISNGYSKRSNSVNVIYPCCIDLHKNIALCDEIYITNNLDTVFKLVENKEACELDNILNKQGYVYESKSNIMIADISEVQISEEEISNVIIYKELKDDWFDAFVHMNNISSKYVFTLKKMLQNIIYDTYYCCIKENNKIIAVGLGVSERGYVGMFDICVDTEKRRQGFGKRIMKNLMYEACKQNNKYSYLQVVDSNEGAKLLYEKLGYKKEYSYWYRIKKFNK